MKTEKSCDNCIYSISDWTNVCNSDHYCSNEESEEYGYNAEYLNSCDEWKSIEQNLGNNGSICTKTGSNDEDRIADDCISRKQAIEAFEPTHYKDWYTPTIIETLETLPSVRPEVLACGSGELVKESDGLVNDLVKDCISRKMVIDAIEEMQLPIMRSEWLSDQYKFSAFAEVREMISELPSAQPTQTNADSTQTNALDCVSRQQAIDALDGFRCGTKAAWKVIEDLPSAQPQRRTGKWIKISPANIYECSECGKNVMTDDISAYDFCHGCGADMRGESE